jgi:alpha-D-ribose 1-methylphosphonate 5-triphosphate synthase subunit PhnG
MTDVSPTDRAQWMGVLARARAQDVARLWAALGLQPAHRWLRRAEVGMVMLRGRAGGTGAPFNLGEMTVTRASVLIEGDVVGHAWVQGRAPEQAEIAALADALLQTAHAPRVADALIAPLAQAEAARRDARAGKAAATKVEFFTMVRGEA